MTDIQSAFCEAKIDYQGSEFTLSAPNYSVVRDYTKFLEEEAIKGVIRNKDAYGFEFRAELKSVRDSITAGHYRWGGPVMMESMNDPEKQMKFAYLLFKIKHPEMSWGLFDTIWKTDDKFIHPETNELMDGIKGDVIMLKIGEFFRRPNLHRPDTVPGAPTQI